MYRVLLLCLFVCIIRYMYLRISSIVNVRVRKSILDKHSLSFSQARYQVSTGKDVYMESVKDRMYVMLSGAGPKVIMKNLFSGKKVVCDMSFFMDTFNSLVDNGYKFYASRAYSELRKRGFELGYDYF